MSVVPLLTVIPPIALPVALGSTTNSAGATREALQAEPRKIEIAAKEKSSREPHLFSLAQVVARRMPPGSAMLPASAAPSAPR